MYPEVSNMYDFFHFVFDDEDSDKKDKIKEYFSRVRRKSIDPLYLCQLYSELPKYLHNSKVISLER